MPFALVVDGNVFRVLSRYFGIDLATDTTEGKKIFSSLAQELLDKKQPGLYNQAIMGAWRKRRMHPMWIAANEEAPLTCVPVRASRSVRRSP